MAVSKPTEDILWGESAAGGDVTDPSGKRSAGYLFEDPWPHDEANYMFRAIGRFANWIGRSAGRFSTPASSLSTTGVGAIAPGETLISGRSSVPGLATVVASFSETMVDCDHDGVFLVALEQADAGVTAAQVHLYDASGINALSQFATQTTAADAQAIACNGEYIAVLRGGGEIEVYDYAGSLKFSADRVGASTDIAMDNVRLYACGAAAVATGGTNSREAQAWTLSTGAFAWEFDSAFGATLNSIATDGSYVYAGGNTTFGGDSLVRAVAGTGAISAQGGSAVVADKNRVLVGPNSIYAICGSSSPEIFEYTKTRAAVFTQISTFAFGSGSAAGGGAIDDRYLYAVSNSILHAIPIDRDLATEWRGFQISMANTPSWLVSSGQYLYIANNGTGVLQRQGVGRRFGVWEYTGTTPDPYHWFRRRFIPGD